MDLLLKLDFLSDVSHLGLKEDILIDIAPAFHHCRAVFGLNHHERRCGEREGITCGEGL